MKALQDKAQSYLQMLDDSALFLQPEEVSLLPLVLRERYSLHRARLFGRDWLFAIETEGWDPGSPSEYRHHWQSICQTAGKEHTALILPFLSATVRNRLIRQGVPFIVPNTQVYLPLCMISLKESFGGSQSLAGKQLSPAAQVLLLRQLEQANLQNRSSKEISDLIGYSRATTSTACAELEQHELCRTFRKGKELHIEFAHAPGELWNTALPLLRSPVRKIVFVQKLADFSDIKLAGTSALSEYSELAADRVPTYALNERRLREGFEQGSFRGVPDRHEADARLEAWSYDPLVLSQAGTVDRLSLFLSLWHNPDERIQAGLKAMMENPPWQ